MPDTAGHARAIEMRLSVPSDEALRSIAGALAAKIAEFLGAPAPDAESLGRRVDGLAAAVANGAGQAAIEFEFRQVERELIVAARCNKEASEVRHPLPA